MWKALLARTMSHSKLMTRKIVGVAFSPLTTVCFGPPPCAIFCDLSSHDSSHVSEVRMGRYSVSRSQGADTYTVANCERNLLNILCHETLKFYQPGRNESFDALPCPSCLRMLLCS